MATEVTIAIIVSSLALIGSLITIITAAKKNDVETLSEDVNILRGIIKESKDYIQELKEYIEELEIDKEDLQAWAEKLVCQIKNAGLVPEKFERSQRKIIGKSNK
jgi:hypothetical protein